MFVPLDSYIKQMMLQVNQGVIIMNDKPERMYNMYVMGKITLKKLLEWNDRYMKEREVKNVS